MRAVRTVVEQSLLSYFEKVTVRQSEHQLETEAGPELVSQWLTAVQFSWSSSVGLGTYYLSISVFPQVYLILSFIYVKVDWGFFLSLLVVLATFNY